MRKEEQKEAHELSRRRMAALLHAVATAAGRRIAPTGGRSQLCRSKIAFSVLVAGNVDNAADDNLDISDTEEPKEVDAA